MNLIIKLLSIFIVCITLAYSCSMKSQQEQKVEIKNISFIKNDSTIINTDSILLMNRLDSIFNKKPNYIADTFIFPIGIYGSAENYKISQPFWNSRFHLGEDWINTILPKNGFGDSVYSIANGYVIDAYCEIGGWGNVIKIFHKVNSDSLKYVVSLYAHLHEIFVKKGDLVKKNDKIGTIGDSNGKFAPHLHFELRTDVTSVTGSGYGYSDFESYYLSKFINPSDFINMHRVHYEK